MKKPPRKRLCGPHLNGVKPSYPPFFYDSCHQCQQKKAEGLVTGDEGPLGRKAPRSAGTAAGARRTAGDRRGSGSTG